MKENKLPHNHDKNEEKILDKMIWAFYLYISVDSLYWTEEQKQQINEGLKLFAEYFQSLWD